MKVVEYGKHNKEVVMFLHGGGLSWWNYQEVAELLQKRYHSQTLYFHNPHISPADIFRINTFPSQ